MKYLVIGDSNSMHIFNFVKNFLLPKGYEVHLLSLSTQSIKESFRNFYRENGVVVHSVAERGYRGLNKTSLPYRLLNLWRKLRLMKELKNVDVCHVQSVYKTALLMVLQNKKKIQHLILSYWGGDVEDINPHVLSLREKCFNFADVITVTVKQTLLDFQRIHGHAYDEKLMISRFATEGLDCIKQLSETSTREACRNEYNVASNKILITCGYSAYPEQHQDTCLEVIKALPNDLRNRIHVIIPMQYGRFDLSYINKVSFLAASCDFPCDILHEYVPFEKSAMLAVATDIYLHVRDTDAFSNALKEHVFAGSNIIKGDWLSYIELTEMNALVKSIATLDDLSTALENALNDYIPCEKITLFAPIYEMYSTESINAQWQAVLEKAIPTGNGKDT